MKNNLLILFFACISLMAKSQVAQISLLDYNSTEITSIEQYWLWAAGVTVVGNGFEANSSVELMLADPNGSKRYFTATSDENGDFIGWVNSKTNLSVLGIHTISATDAVSNSAEASIEVVKDPTEVLTVEVSPSEVLLNDFEKTGVDLTIKGVTPQALLKINITTPSGTGNGLMPNTELYADAKGSITLHLDSATQIGTSFGTNSLPSIEGLWTISAFDNTEGDNRWGRCQFRMVRNEEGVDSYCEIDFSEKVLPLTSVKFADIVSATPIDDINGYIDNSSIKTDVHIGETYSIHVSGVSTWDWTANTFTAFIDWNQNGTIDEEGEIYSIGSVIGSTGEDDQFAMADITVPATAKTGLVRMRVLNVYSPSPTAMFWPTGACGTYTSGQAQDFTLNVVETPTNIHNNTAFGFDFYPNPNDGNMFIETSAKGLLKLIDIAGNELYSKQISNGVTNLNVSLKSGIYIMLFKSDNMTKTKRVVIK